MTEEALRAALWDLAWFGWVILDNYEDAVEVARAAPVKCRIVPAQAGCKSQGRWWVEALVRTTDKINLKEVPVNGQ